MSSRPPFGAAKVKRRRRGDKHHCHNAGLRKSIGLKTLPLPYDVWRSWDYLYLDYVAFRRKNKVITIMVIKPLDDPT